MLLPFRFDISSVSHLIKTWKEPSGVPNKIEAEDVGEDEGVSEDENIGEDADEDDGDGKDEAEAEAEDEDEDEDGYEDGYEDAKHAISNSFLAKVHAEAALMFYITTIQVRLWMSSFTIHSYCLIQDVGCSQEWLIGTSKKACQSCWLLHEIYNKSQKFNFILPGTHRTFFSWVPPPGLPDVVLLELRDALVEVCASDSASPAHSRQSSICSATSVVDDFGRLLKLGIVELAGSKRNVA